MTGAQDLSIDGGAVIPTIDPVTGLPVAGAALTTWAALFSVAPGSFLGRAMNLANGTTIYVKS